MPKSHEMSAYDPDAMPHITPAETHPAIETAQDLVDLGWNVATRIFDATFGKFLNK